MILREDRGVVECYVYVWIEFLGLSILRWRYVCMYSMYGGRKELIKRTNIANQIIYFFPMYQIKSKIDNITKQGPICDSTASHATNTAGITQEVENVVKEAQKGKQYI